MLKLFCCFLLFAPLIEYLSNNIYYMANDHEIEFHEIESCLFRRSKLGLFLRSKVLIIFQFLTILFKRSTLQSWDQKLLTMHFRLLISWSKLRLQKCSWDWKSKKHYFWLSISWKIVSHKNDHEIQSFYALVANN